MYKQDDFEKYLSDQYETYKEYTQYYGDLLYNVENPEKNTHSFQMKTLRNNRR